MMTISKEFTPSHIVLSGGVGGAKLVQGLTACLDAEQLMIIGNIGDDFEHWGFHISPDLDTLLYTLSGVSNQALGWGREGDTWAVLEEVSRLGGDAWFQLGDRDLAVHIERSSRLRRGESLSAITMSFCRGFGLEYNILPPSDDCVRTVVTTKVGDLDFQEYFVRHKCEPAVVGISYDGGEKARLLPFIESALHNPSLRAVIISPSNPFLSVAPILAISNFRELLTNCDAPRIVISPMIGAKAFKGPTAKIMGELGYEMSSFAVAAYYSSNLIDGIVIDVTDSVLAPRIEALGIKTFMTDISMNSLKDKKRLAKQAIQFSESLLE